jgi:hypothetical protein
MSDGQVTEQEVRGREVGLAKRVGVEVHLPGSAVERFPEGHRDIELMREVYEGVEGQPQLVVLQPLLNGLVIRRSKVGQLLSCGVEVPSRALPAVPELHMIVIYRAHRSQTALWRQVTGQAGTDVWPARRPPGGTVTPALHPRT